MSKLELLKSLVTQRLTSAAGDISGLFESTMADEEDELCDLRKANARQRKLLDAVHDPDIRIHRADVQQLLVGQGEVPPEQQVWSSSPDQQDPEPPHSEEDQELRAGPGEPKALTH